MVYAASIRADLPAVLYLSMLSQKRRDFLEKVVDHKMCILIFSETFVWKVPECKKD